MKTIYLTFFFCLLVGSALAEPLQPESSAQAEAETFMAVPIGFFQRYLSGADGHRCPMTPSCSTYARQAIARYGVLRGWIMASDRLLRCGRDELRHSPSVMTRYGLRCQDPVENNAFGLKSP